MALNIRKLSFHFLPLLVYTWQSFCMHRRWKNNFIISQILKNTTQRIVRLDGKFEEKFKDFSVTIRKSKCKFKRPGWENRQKNFQKHYVVSGVKTEVWTFVKILRCGLFKTIDQNFEESYDFGLPWHQRANFEWSSFEYRTELLSVESEKLAHCLRIQWSFNSNSIITAKKITSPRRSDLTKFIVTEIPFAETSQISTSRTVLFDVQVTDVILRSFAWHDNKIKPKRKKIVKASDIAERCFKTEEFRKSKKLANW